eukprot:m.2680 g.2680  ORF g.2680 m.2680 type:complete len:56 (-) comp1021_c0_seq1:160-327(-)
MPGCHALDRDTQPGAETIHRASMAMQSPCHTTMSSSAANRSYAPLSNASARGAFS